MDVPSRELIPCVGSNLESHGLAFGSSFHIGFCRSVLALVDGNRELLNRLIGRNILDIVNHHLNSLRVLQIECVLAFLERYGERHLLPFVLGGELDVSLLSIAVEFHVESASLVVCVILDDKVVISSLFHRDSMAECACLAYCCLDKAVT